MTRFVPSAGSFWTMLASPLRVRRTRRRVCSALQPFMTRGLATLGPVADETWRDPYLTGFLVVAITHLAQRGGPSLGSDALARVQADCWRMLTGMADPDIGERMTLLSLARDPDFLVGCRDAADWVQNAGWVCSPASDDAAGISLMPPTMSVALWDGWETTAMRRMEELNTKTFTAPGYL